MDEKTREALDALGLRCCGTWSACQCQHNIGRLSAAVEAARAEERQRAADYVQQRAAEHNHHEGRAIFVELTDVAAHIAHGDDYPSGKAPQAPEENVPRNAQRPCPRCGVQVTTDADRLRPAWCPACNWTEPAPPLPPPEQERHDATCALHRDPERGVCDCCPCNGCDGNGDGRHRGDCPHRSPEPPRGTNTFDQVMEEFWSQSEINDGTEAARGAQNAAAFIANRFRTLLCAPEPEPPRGRPVGEIVALGVEVCLKAWGGSVVLVTCETEADAERVAADLTAYLAGLDYPATWIPSGGPPAPRVTILSGTCPLCGVTWAVPWDGWSLGPCSWVTPCCRQYIFWLAENAMVRVARPLTERPGKEGT